jgi:hypothetical protein
VCYEVLREVTENLIVNVNQTESVSLASLIQSSIHLQYRMNYRMIMHWQGQTLVVIELVVVWEMVVEIGWLARGLDHDFVYGV